MKLAKRAKQEKKNVAETLENKRKKRRIMRERNSLGKQKNKTKSAKEGHGKTVNMFFENVKTFETQKQTRNKTNRVVARHKKKSGKVARKLTQVKIARKKRKKSTGVKTRSMARKKNHFRKPSKLLGDKQRQEHKKIQK